MYYLYVHVAAPPHPRLLNERKTSHTSARTAGTAASCNTPHSSLPGRIMQIRRGRPSPSQAVISTAPLPTPCKSSCSTSFIMQPHANTLCLRLRTCFLATVACNVMYGSLPCTAQQCNSRIELWSVSRNSASGSRSRGRRPSSFERVKLILPMARRLAELFDVRLGDGQLLCELRAAPILASRCRCRWSRR